MNDTHAITVGVERRIGSISWYRATCSCGWYSPMHGTTAHVQRWADTHKQMNLKEVSNE